MFLPLASRAPVPTVRNAPIQVRLVAAEEQDLWARTAAEGWRELSEIADLLFEVMLTSAARADALSFLAELDGQPIAAASLVIENGVALLAGSSTIAEWRQRGAQRAVLESRLEYSARAGCDMAMICAEPGSASQRNAERQGFRIAYTRIKWGLMSGVTSTGNPQRL